MLCKNDVKKEQIDGRTLLFLLDINTVCVSYKASNGQATDLLQNNPQLAERWSWKKGTTVCHWILRTPGVWPKILMTVVTLSFSLSPAS